MNVGTRLGFAVGLLLAAAAVADAQSTTYLSPARYDAEVGERLALGLEASGLDGRSPVAWSHRASRWLLVRAAGTQSNQDRPTLDREGTASIEISRPGVHLIGLDLAPRLETVGRRAAAEFFSERLGREPTLHSHGGDPLVLRRVESGKALVQVRGLGGIAHPSATAQSKTGQAVEIRPLIDPTTAAVGADLPLKVYTPLGASDGLAVRATHVESGASRLQRTNPSGVAHFRITAPGLWRVEAHHAVPSVAEDEADWVLYSATLVFVVDSATVEAGSAP